MRFLLLAALLVGEVQASDVDTRKFSGVVFDAATPGREYASITWRSDAVQGRRLIGFTTSPDGARHTYWFDFTNRQGKRRLTVMRERPFVAECFLAEEQTRDGFLV